MELRLITSSLGLLTLLIANTSTQAQNERGRWTIGAQLGNLTYKNQSGNRTFSASLNPSAGYFVATGFVIGTGILMSTSTQKSTDAFPVTYNYSGMGLGVSPFVRYFLGKHALKPYVGLAYSYSRLNFKYNSRDANGNYDSNGNTTFTTFMPTLGMAYFINRSLGLTLSLNYTINHQGQQTFNVMPYSPSPTFSSYNNRSLSLGIGFQLFIGK